MYFPFGFCTKSRLFSGMGLGFLSSYYIFIKAEKVYTFFQWSRKSLELGIWLQVNAAKLTQNLKRGSLKRTLVGKEPTFRFHVSFPECIWFRWSNVFWSSGRQALCQLEPSRIFQRSVWQLNLRRAQTSVVEPITRHRYRYRYQVLDIGIDIHVRYWAPNFFGPQGYFFDPNLA